MKKITEIALSASLLASSFSPCFQAMAATPKSNFKKVTSHIDSNGEYFKYAKIDSLQTELDKGVAQIEKMLLADRSMNADQKELATEGIKLTKSFIQDSGLLDLDAIGMSSIRKEGYYHNKSILHSKKSEGSVFKMLGGQAHDLTSQKFLPKNTVLAASGELKLIELWNALVKVTKMAENPQIKQAPQMVSGALGALKIDLPLLLKEQTGELGFYLTANAEKQLTMPGRGPKLVLPQLDATIFLARKGKTLDKMIFKNLPKNLKTETVDGFTITTLPALPNPMQTQAAIATSDNYFFLSTNVERLKESIANLKSGKGLTSTEKFKKLSADVPVTGNSYLYLDPSISQTLVKLALTVVPKAQSEQAKLIADKIPENIFFYGVNQVTPNGFKSTNNSILRQDAFGGSVLVPVAVTGVLAAMVMPALAKSRAKAKQTQGRNTMKQMGLNIASSLADQAAQDVVRLPELNAKAGGVFEDIFVDANSAIDPFYGKRYVYSGEIVDGVKIEAGAIFKPSMGRHDVNLIIVEGASKWGGPKYAPYTPYSLRGDFSVGDKASK